jgi:hypothetical protein
MNNEPTPLLQEGDKHFSQATPSAYALARSGTFPLKGKEEVKCILK